MKPLRMCMVCRNRAEKEALVRMVKKPDGSIALDAEGKMPGRGAYLCKKRECIEAAQKKRALERAFSQKIEPEVYNALWEVTADEC